MDLDHVEAGVFRHGDRAGEIVAHRVHIGAVHRLGCRAPGLVGNGRGREQRPVARVQRLVLALPHHLGRALAPGMRELQADFGQAVFVNEVDDPLPRNHVLAFVHSGALQGDAPLG